MEVSVSIAIQKGLDLTREAGLTPAIVESDDVNGCVSLTIALVEVKPGGYCITKMFFKFIFYLKNHINIKHFKKYFN